MVCASMRKLLGDLFYIPFICAGILIVLTIVLLFTPVCACSSKLQDAEMQVENTGHALALYRIKFGRYPSTEEGLIKLTQKINGRPPIMESLYTDPWQQDLVYISPGIRNPDSFDLFSKGPDMKANTEDDVIDR